MEYFKELQKGLNRNIIVITILAVTIAILEFITPFFIRNLIDNFEANYYYVIKMSIYVWGLFLVIYIANIAINNMKKYFYVRFKVKETNKLYENMFHMKYEELIKKEPTYLVEKINNSIDVLYTLYFESLPNYLIAIFSIILSLIIMANVNWCIMLCMFINIPIQIIGYKKLNEKLSDKCIKLQTLCAKNFKNILSITSEVDYYKQLSRAEEFIKMLKPYVQKIHNENGNVNAYATFVSVTLNHITNFLNNYIYIVAALLTCMEKITVSDFVFICMIESVFFPAVNNIVSININLRDLKGVKQFIKEELLAYKEEEGCERIGKISEVEFEIKKVGYENSILIETGECRIKQGDVVCVKGNSGCGKSSLLKGLVKFTDVENIYLNGVDIESISNESLRERVVYYSQSIPIISGTIRDNILMGKKDEHIIERLKEKKFIRKFFELKDGIDTTVLENGANLSGGDKQKIALARIYGEDPDVIILDEMTNSLDEESEQIILTDIMELFADKIIFIISHSDKIVPLCNKIMRIEDKELVLQNI